MSAPPTSAGRLIDCKADMVQTLQKGEKSKDQWRIGTEHEKFAFTREDLRPLPFEGERSISTLLESLSQLGWSRLEEDDNLFALTKNGANITLEPGGQFELSGAPLQNLHQTCCEIHDHLQEVKQVADPLNIGFIGVGSQPLWGLEDVPQVPRPRYSIMRSYMKKVGSLGLEMMHMTCAIQVNLDFQNEADMVKKLRTSLALQPIATAIFANSPFRHGTLNGMASWRSHIWSNTDTRRSGGLDWAFEDGMSYERYVDYALDVPMYFIYRDGHYIDVAGQSFRDFLNGNLPGLPGEKPTVGDWENHLTTVFPDVRLKSFLEMRGADGSPWGTICALPALWTGLLYDDTALNAAWDMVKSWTAEDRRSLAQSAAKDGLRGNFSKGSIAQTARQVVELAEQGLKSRAKPGVASSDETEYLDALREPLEQGRSPAHQFIELYKAKWNGSVEPIFRTLEY